MISIKVDLFPDKSGPLSFISDQLTSAQNYSNHYSITWASQITPSLSVQAHATIIEPNIVVNFDKIVTRLEL